MKQRRCGSTVLTPAGNRDYERGSIAFELVAWFAFLSVIALTVLQIAAVGQSAVAARTAARAASRVAAQGGDLGEVNAAATNAVAPSMRQGIKIATTDGTRVTVSVAIPIVLPGLATTAWSVTRTAEFPET